MTIHTKPISNTNNIQTTIEVPNTKTNGTHTNKNMFDTTQQNKRHATTKTKQKHIRNTNQIATRIQKTYTQKTTATSTTHQNQHTHTNTKNTQTTIINKSKADQNTQNKTKTKPQQKTTKIQTHKQTHGQNKTKTNKNKHQKPHITTNNDENNTYTTIYSD